MPSLNEITIPQLSRLIGTHEAQVLIDVCINDDFDADLRLIPTSFRHPFSETTKLAPSLAGKRFVVIFHKGLKLSQGAAAILRAEGITAELLVGVIVGWTDAGLPLVPADKIPTPSLWVTRHRPKIDRIACPWLIRRFVDPSARFLFVSPSEVEAVADRFHATPFDIEGAFWSQRGERISFDVILDEFVSTVGPGMDLRKVVIGRHRKGRGDPMAGSTSPSLAEAVRAWAYVGVLSFGGPNAQIELLHKVVVNQKKWLFEQKYLNVLGFCLLLPGPEAMQLAKYVGWRLHGVIGGLAAGLLFVVPGAIVVLVLAMVYALFGDTPALGAIFLGVKAAILLVVIEALLRVAKCALKSTDHWVLAALAFVAPFFLALPFPLVVFAAAVWGFCRGLGGVADEASPITARPRHLLSTVCVWSVIWLAPVLALWMTLGDHVLVDVAIFCRSWWSSPLAAPTRCWLTWPRMSLALMAG
jgi:chromate transport protein ChrA/rhodanese-related sulfurtransferase